MTIYVNFFNGHFYMIFFSIFLKTIDLPVYMHHHFEFNLRRNPLRIHIQKNAAPGYDFRCVGEALG